MSRPTWARGLKLAVSAVSLMLPLSSRPTWARGLKLCSGVRLRKYRFVAPHVGAWIETITVMVGGWLRSSRPTWARGLKQFSTTSANPFARVAPHVGARIETNLRTLTLPDNMSRAPRGRVD